LELEQEFQSHLHNAWISRGRDITESALTGIVEVPRWIVKLRVVEDVKRFCPELHFLGL
jgi:hypothetical protein